MKLVRLKTPGGLDNLRLVEEASPKPRPCELLVRIRACSLNAYDDMVALGKIPCVDGRAPMTDGAGDVVAVGDDVDEFKVGDFVVSRFWPYWLGGEMTPATKRIIPGETIDVGGPGTLTQSISPCRTGGHIALIGVLTGFAAEVSIPALFSNQIRISGISVGNRADQEGMIRAIDANRLKPRWKTSLLHSSATNPKSTSARFASSCKRMCREKRFIATKDQGATHENGEQDNTDRRAKSSIGRALAIFAFTLLSFSTSPSQAMEPTIEQMPPELETRFALSALPPALRAKATVHLLDPKRGYKLSRQGASGVTCIVQRTVWEMADFRNDIYTPLCYDAVGTNTYLKVIMDAAELRARVSSPGSSPMAAISSSAAAARPAKCVWSSAQQQPNRITNTCLTNKRAIMTPKKMTTQEVAARFNELAQQEKWFEIQDELFAEDVRSIEPPTAKDLPNAQGKAAVRKKGENLVSQVEAVHKSSTTAPVVAGTFFAVGRELDMTVRGAGRTQMNEVMLYEVKDGQIVSEQFFY